MEARCTPPTTEPPPGGGEEEPGPPLPPPPPPPNPERNNTRGANFWLGATTGGAALPLSTQTCIHLRNNWDVRYMRINMLPNSMPSADEITATLSNVLSAECIPLLVLHSAPGGAAPVFEEVRSVWDEVLWPALNAISDGEAVHFSPTHQPFRHGVSDAREQWLKFHSQIFDHCLTTGFDGTLVANAPWWGQDRETAEMPIEKSCLLNEGQTLVDRFGGPLAVGLDVHIQSYWDPMWKRDNQVDVDYMVEYFNQLADITHWPIVGSYGGPVPAKLIPTPGTTAGIAWWNALSALPDYGAALKLGLSMADPRWDSTVVPCVWEASRGPARLHYNQSVISGTNLPNNGWMGTAESPIIPEDVLLTPVGDIHMGRHENLEAYWAGYVELPEVNWL